MDDAYRFIFGGDVRNQSSGIDLDPDSSKEHDAIGSQAPMETTFSAYGTDKHHRTVTMRPVAVDTIMNSFSFSRKLLLVR